MPRLSLVDRLKMVLSLGTLAGLGAAVFFILYQTVYIICEWLWPRDTIDIAEEFNVRAYSVNPGKFGDHKFEVVKTMPVQSRNNTAASRIRFEVKPTFP